MVMAAAMAKLIHQLDRSRIANSEFSFIRNFMLPGFRASGGKSLPYANSGGCAGGGPGLPGERVDRIRLAEATSLAPIPSVAPGGGQADDWCFSSAAAPFRGPDGMIADGSPTIPDRDYFRRAQEEVIERMIKAGVI